MTTNKLTNWIKDLITLLVSVFFLLIVFAILAWFFGLLIGVICKLFMLGYQLWS